MAEPAFNVNATEWPPPEWPVAGRPASDRALFTVVPSDDEVPTTHEAQAAAEGVVIEEGDFLEFFGQRFRLADKIGLAPLIRFGHAANRGLDSEDMEGLAAMYSMIRGVIHRPPLFGEDGQQQVDENGKRLRDETEWNRFMELAEDECAEGEEIMDFVNRAMAVMSARPRKPREISSGGSRPTSANSRGDSSSPVTNPQAAGLVPVSELGR